MKKIFPAFLGMILALSMLVTCPVYAKNGNTQTILLTAIDDWYDNALAGMQVTLEKKTGDSYGAIQGKSNVKIPASGMEFALEEGEYRFTVEKVPNGYLTSDQPVEFQVTGSAVTLLQAENAELLATEEGFALHLFCAQDYDDGRLVMPSTGSRDRASYTVGGLVFMAAAVFGGILLLKKDTKKLLGMLLVAGASAVLIGMGTSLPVTAAETNGTVPKGYQYYAMMKTLEMGASAEYYVEDAQLAAAIEGLTIRGKAVFTVEKAKENLWYITTCDDADCTPKEVAKALAEIKEYAIESGRTTDFSVELEYGAVVLAGTRAGTYFVKEVEAGKHYLVERPVTVKNDMPTVSMSVISDGNGNSNAANAEIGKTIEYQIWVQISTRYFADVTLYLNVPQGLTLGATEVEYANDTGNSGPTEENIAFTAGSSSNGVTSYKMVFPKESSGVNTTKQGTYKITGTVTVNENAQAGREQKLTAHCTYKENDGGYEMEGLNNTCAIYTFGFDLQRVGSANEPLAGVKYALKNEAGEYYTLPSDTTNVNEARFVSQSDDQIPTVTTSSDEGTKGKTSFVGLAAGEYTLTEIGQSGDDVAWTKEFSVMVNQVGEVALSDNAPAGVSIAGHTEYQPSDSYNFQTTYYGTLKVTGTPKVSALAVEGKANEAIGGTVNYHMDLAIPSGAQNVKLCLKVPEGLTLSAPAGSGITLTLDSAQESTDGTKIYTISADGDAGFIQGTYTITGTASFNENAQAGAAQKLEAYLTYGDQGSSSSKEITFYTFGFDLQMLNGVNEPLEGAAFSLKSTAENAVETTLTTDSNGMIRFHGIAAGNYTLTQKATPEGYTLLSAPLEVTIGEDGSLTLGENSPAEIKKWRGENALYDTLTMTNQVNIAMPMTGSNSRNAFHMAGGMLILLTGALWVIYRKEFFNTK